MAVTVHFAITGGWHGGSRRRPSAPNKEAELALATWNGRGRAGPLPRLVVTTVSDTSDDSPPVRDGRERPWAEHGPADILARGGRGACEEGTGPEFNVLLRRLAGMPLGRPACRSGLRSGAMR